MCVLSRLVLSHFISLPIIEGIMLHHLSVTSPARYSFFSPPTHTKQSSRDEASFRFIHQWPHEVHGVCPLPCTLFVHFTESVHLNSHTDSVMHTLHSVIPFFCLQGQGQIISSTIKKRCTFVRTFVVLEIITECNTDSCKFNK